MFQDNIFDKWLDTKTQEIIKNMGDGKPLSSEEMMVLVLKAQTNHFNHLDIELRDDMRTLREDLTNDMKTLRQDMDKRFEQVDKRFESLVTRMDRLMIWTFATTVSVGGIVIAAIKFLP
jgi:hypothetical protein